MVGVCMCMCSVCVMALFRFGNAWSWSFFPPYLVSSFEDLMHSCWIFPFCVRGFCSEPMKRQKTVYSMSPFGLKSLLWLAYQKQVHSYCCWPSWEAPFNNIIIGVCLQSQPEFYTLRAPPFVVKNMPIHHILASPFSS
jgi:hypothetical protein